MGCDKALVHLAGKPLIRHVIDAVDGLADEIVVTTNRPREFAFLGCRLVTDVVPGAGALPGLLTALSAARNDTVLVLACDMPFVCRPLLQYELVLASTADVLIPRWGGDYEPLHAVYARSCGEVIAESLASGNRRIVGFLSRVRVRTVEETEVAHFDPTGRCFKNVNTPADLAEAERSLQWAVQAGRA
jgi:molybdopterin-guanine dinucleotide biosynthesis protein A